jgi:hypothetical protein
MKMNSKNEGLGTPSNALVASRMFRCIRHTLALNFPETRQELALTVLMRLATHIAVDCTGRERAPHVMSRLINQFLLTDHYE